MGIALVQHTSGQENNTAASVTVTFASTTQSGNFIAALVTLFTTNTVGMSVADGGTNTWAQAFTGPHSSGNAYVYLFFAYNITGKASHQITATAPNTSYITLSISEWSGVLASGSPLDQHNTNTGTATSATPGSVTGAVANELYLNVMTEDNAVSVGTPTSGYTLLDNITTGQDLHSQYQIVSGTPASNPALSVGSSNAWADGIATFKPASGGTDTLAFATTDTDTVTFALSDSSVLAFSTTDKDTVTFTLSDQSALSLATTDTDTVTFGLNANPVIALATTDRDTVSFTLSDSSVLAFGTTDTDTVSFGLQDIPPAGSDRGSTMPLMHVG